MARGAGRRGGGLGSCLARLAFAGVCLLSAANASPLWSEEDEEPRGRPAATFGEAEGAAPEVRQLAQWGADGVFRVVDTAASSLSASATWATREYHAVASLDSEIFVLGGWHRDSSNAYVALNDVWSSADGVSWTQRSAAAGWSARYRHTADAVNGELVVCGGYSVDSGGSGVFWNDVWSSTDGAAWTQVLAAAPWGARSYHATAVLDGELFITGGMNVNGGVNYLRDVWSSADGATWAERTPSAPWGARYGHQLVASDGQLVLAGGYGDGVAYLSDVWTSGDGAAWTQLLASGHAMWAARRWHTLSALGGELVLLAGETGGSHRRRRCVVNDVWSSSDGGASWTRAVADGSSPWERRYYGRSAVLNGQVVVAGGNNEAKSRMSDVWAVASLVPCTTFASQGTCPSPCTWEAGACDLVTSTVTTSTTITSTTTVTVSTTTISTTITSTSTVTTATSTTSTTTLSTTSTVTRTTTSTVTSTTITLTSTTSTSTTNTHTTTTISTTTTTTSTATTTTTTTSTLTTTSSTLTHTTVTSTTSTTTTTGTTTSSTTTSTSRTSTSRTTSTTTTSTKTTTTTSSTSATTTSTSTSTVSSTTSTSATGTSTTTTSSSTTTTSTTTTSTLTTTTSTTTMTPEAILKTAFEARVTTPRARDFSTRLFAEAVRASLGVRAWEVEVLSTSYEVAIQYAFTSAVTERQVVVAAASAHDVPEADVAVTIAIASGGLSVSGSSSSSSVRSTTMTTTGTATRLRRLSSFTAVVVIRNLDASAADSVEALLIQLGTIQASLRGQGVETTPSVAQAPEIRAKVEASVTPALSWHAPSGDNLRAAVETTGSSVYGADILLSAVQTEVVLLDHASRGATATGTTTSQTSTRTTSTSSTSTSTPEVPSMLVQEPTQRTASSALVVLVLLAFLSLLGFCVCFSGGCGLCWRWCCGPKRAPKSSEYEGGGTPVGTPPDTPPDTPPMSPPGEPESPPPEFDLEPPQKLEGPVPPEAWRRMSWGTTPTSVGESRRSSHNESSFDQFPMVMEHSHSHFNGDNGSYNGSYHLGVSLPASREPTFREGISHTGSREPTFRESTFMSWEVDLSAIAAFEDAGGPYGLGEGGHEIDQTHI